MAPHAWSRSRRSTSSKRQYRYELMGGEKLVKGGSTRVFCTLVRLASMKLQLSSSKLMIFSGFTFSRILSASCGLTMLKDLGKPDVLSERYSDVRALTHAPSTHLRPLSSFFTWLPPAGEPAACAGAASRLSS